MFSLPKGKPEFSKLEESILQYWKENKTFEKSVESRPAENLYRFYDGPPFITGTPHYGSLLSSIIKDVVPRYQTMLGKRVERVWGWDCHGLPIEQKVQKKLGLESNKEIEESAGGIQGFIDECYNYTGSTSAEWNWYIDHIGRWVDMDNAYRTMDQDYMESVIWVFKQIWEKGYVYEGKRVSWYSWKLSTPISNFEIAMDDSYQDVQDPAITVKFPLKEIKKGAGAIIRDEDGKLLMIRNKKDGLWRIPGGHVEDGESYHDVAARELLEETGITCKLESAYNFYHTYRGSFYYAERFSGTVPVGTKVKLEEDKYSEYEYFALDALPVRSEIHYIDNELFDSLTGVREPVKVSGPLPVSFLAWTTTPWTMPMHMALAVNKDITYAQVLCNDEVFILAQSRVEAVFKGKGDYKIIGTLRGEELVGLHYQPPFDFYQRQISPPVKGGAEGGGLGENNNPPPLLTRNEIHSFLPFHKEAPNLANSFKVYHADFVTDTDGTGIAHEAPEFGDVDFQLAKQEGIHVTSAIDEAGKYTAEIPDYAGTLYLDAIDPITERLKNEGKLFKKESITHRVPYCPRSNTPLIQKAQKSWFIDIQRIKSELIAQNENINWFPDHFKHGRFLKSLESAPDWCISRSRFWGTPMPIWENSDGSERVVIDSREELYQKNKPLGQITKLVILRHAQSEANVARCYDDTGTSPLSELGKQQAQDIVEKLKTEGVEVIISSPFVRTLETIKPFAELVNIEIQTMEELRETGHGKFSNAPWSELLAQDREKMWQDFDYKFGETGESVNDLIARTNEVLNTIKTKFPGKTVAIVSHGYPIRALLTTLRGKLAERPTNAKIDVVYVDNNTGKELNLHRPTIDRIYVPSQKSVENKKDVTKFIFVRHGESLKNTLGIVDGTDKPRFSLTDEGKKVASETAEKLKGETIDVHFSSTFARAEETSAIINKDRGLEIMFDDRLREVFLGDLDGQKKSEISELYEKELNAYMLDWDYRGPGGAESANDVLARMQDFMAEVVKKYPGKTILVVSHADQIAVILEHLTGRKYFGRNIPLYPKTGQPITLYLDNNTGKEASHTSHNSSFTPKKVLGIHGWTSSGIQKGYDGKWLPLQDKLKAASIQFDVPDFDKNKETTYALWKEKLDTLDVASYDTIIATSFGCPVITQYLCEKNIKLKRLILVAPSGLKGNEYLEKVIPEMTENVEKLRGLVEEIIIPHSEDDDSTSARFEYGKSLAKRIGAIFLPINGVGHKFGGWSIDFLSSLIQYGAPLRRIPEVLDVWMDSASMPYAQVHYPFENREKMEASFPADFIAEYTGQIRAWFYVMHVLGVLVKGSPAFKNVAVTGVINGTDGRKMSKSYGNYPDPRETIEKYGADAIRFYLMSGPIMRGEDMNFSEAGIAESIKRVLLPLWNAYTFFATYANIDGWQPESKQTTVNGKQELPVYISLSTVYSAPKSHELDIWIISQLHTLIRDVRAAMDAYDTQKTGDLVMTFLDGLNNWYIRRNRRRFWKNGLDADKKSAYETLHEVLVTMTKLLAPICPFITEYLYGNLIKKDQISPLEKGGGGVSGLTPSRMNKDEGGLGKEKSDKENDNLQSSVPPQAGHLLSQGGNDTDSVHLCDFPVSNPVMIDEAVNQKMSDLQNLTNLGLAIRGREKLRVRQPLRSATITLDLDESARAVLTEELNVKEIHTVQDVSEYVTITYSPDAKKIGATDRKQWMKIILSEAKSGRGILMPNGDLVIKAGEIAGGECILTADEFETVYTPKEGSTIAFAGSAGYVIGLDTTLDEALTVEGYARDLIRGIQDARKELGFEVTDRLQLSLSSENPLLSEILATHQGMIEKETLTTIQDLTPTLSGEERENTGKEVEMDEGFVVKLTLLK